jgi:hypothetical protein
MMVLPMVTPTKGRSNPAATAASVASRKVAIANTPCAASVVCPRTLEVLNAHPATNRMTNSCVSPGPMASLAVWRPLLCAATQRLVGPARDGPARP